MKKEYHPLYSTPVAILVGSVLISLSVLVSGGIIKIGQATAPTAPGAAKTEAQIVKSLKNYAKKAKLNASKFNKCLDSGEKANLVSADLTAGSSASVSGTPAFFINGHLISGAQPLSVFKDAIEFALRGGDWDSPDPAVSYMVDGNEGNGEIAKDKQFVDNGNLPVRGNANAPVTIIEFSDYQCPFCERFFQATEKQLVSDYVGSGKVKFYYRDFPLSQIHPGAQKGAEAVRCAGDQNKYWEFHDLVFSNQSDIF